MIGAALLVGVALPLTRSSAQGKRFSHNTPAHKTGKYSDCSVCHQLPTPNWRLPRADKLPPFPDVVTYPNPHSNNLAASVCFACHKDASFANGGAFCGACHTVATMKARQVLPFPTISHGSQFETKFPHDKHQDLIAANTVEGPRPVHFVPAAFAVAPDDKKITFYSCAICHTTAAMTPKNGPRPITGFKALADAVADTFNTPVTAKFFKTSPTGHESCFTCHYQFANLPSKQGCASCHALVPQRYFEDNKTERYSLKFNHESSGHTGKDCTSCHIRITQNSDARLMKDADVPISSCKTCHAQQEDDKDKKALITELDARAASVKDKKPVFQCTYCHTSAIGRYEVPKSHLIQ